MKTQTRCTRGTLPERRSGGCASARARRPAARRRYRLRPWSRVPSPPARPPTRARTVRDWYEQVWEQAPPDPEPWAWARRRRWLQAEVRPGERVLDLGCGSGRFLRAIADAG